ncbi:alpha-ketoglutarate-dependent dioxygenase alkB [Pyrus ussuriensis x Pyrus communis]|uniref:Alpha-ketoglutarate-dependent dioxygenase alkB n=1 Tax=Pyrus ussuriensis x Pyrus communis TaxID=2448454 RepID=A0A5N5HA91_9ROSA|nr:alpha-ketoglutarate-dependent dioxygenase alkB [Pyrus ussuriensis x Pyrus communis]
MLLKRHNFSIFSISEYPRHASTMKAFPRFLAISRTSPLRRNIAVGGSSLSFPPKRKITFVDEQPGSKNKNEMATSCLR